MSESRLTLGRDGEVVVRMYGQGFGDCFLLALPRAGAWGQQALDNPVYVLIDCGLFYLTPGEKKRLQAVAASVQAATGGVIDLLVATHEHYDHLSGFSQAAATWKEVEVRRIWLAWTEDPSHPATQLYDREREALQMALAHAGALVEARAAASPAWAAAWRALNGVAAFGGFALGPEEGDPPAGAALADFGVGASSAALRPPNKLSKLPDAIMDALATEPGRIFKSGPVATRTEFCAPGDVRTLPGTAIDAYVLGPPTDARFLGLLEDESEVYSFAAGDGLPARTAAAPFAAALAVHARAGGGDPYVPFRAALCIPYKEAQKDRFFAERYFGLAPDKQIEDEWLRGVGQLALQFDDATNNSSLVLALRLPDGRVLLFAADAQVGNWLSWAEIRPEAWQRPEGGPVAYRPDVGALLAQTVVYKVGHHGSHNATLSAKGLERMPDGVIAFVPVSRAYPQQSFAVPWQIPLPGLLARLKQKCQGRVVLPHDNEIASTAFAATLEAATERLPAMRRKRDDGTMETIEGSVPLWRQVRLEPEAPSPPAPCA